MPKVQATHIHCVQYHPRGGDVMLVFSRESNSIKLIDCRSYEEIKVVSFAIFLEKFYLLYSSEFATTDGKENGINSSKFDSG